MGKPYSRAKNRRGGSFFSYPHSVLRSENYQRLTPVSRALLLEMCTQYNGKNNGNLSCSFAWIQSVGWRVSKSTLRNCLDELAHYGLIVKTQHGGLNGGTGNRPNLYALSWILIDTIEYSDGYAMPSDWKKGDLPATWKEDYSNFEPKKRASGYA